MINLSSPPHSSRASFLRHGKLQRSELSIYSRLQSIMRQPENQKCCDCSRKDPLWASIIVALPGAPDDVEAIAAFCCFQCSKAHRSLGLDVCRVQSLYPVDWTEEDLRAVELGGNYKVNSIFGFEQFESQFQHDFERCISIADFKDRKRFIERKYRCRQFCDKSRFHTDGSQNDDDFDDDDSDNGILHIGLKKPKENDPIVIITTTNGESSGLDTIPDSAATTHSSNLFSPDGQLEGNAVTTNVIDSANKLQSKDDNELKNLQGDIKNVHMPISQTPIKSDSMVACRPNLRRRRSFSDTSQKQASRLIENSMSDAIDPKDESHTKCRLERRNSFNDFFYLIIRTENAASTSGCNAGNDEPKNEANKTTALNADSLESKVEETSVECSELVQGGLPADAEPLHLPVDEQHAKHTVENDENGVGTVVSLSENDAKGNEHEVPATNSNDAIDATTNEKEVLVEESKPNQEGEMKKEDTKTKSHDKKDIKFRRNKLFQRSNSCQELFGSSNSSLFSSAPGQDTYNHLAEKHVQDKRNKNSNDSRNESSSTQPLIIAENQSEESIGTQTKVNRNAARQEVEQVQSFPSASAFDCPFSNQKRKNDSLGERIRKVKEQHDSLTSCISKPRRKSFSGAIGDFSELSLDESTRRYDRVAAFQSPYSNQRPVNDTLGERIKKIKEQHDMLSASLKHSRRNSFGGMITQYFYHKDDTAKEQVEPEGKEYYERYNDAEERFDYHQGKLQDYSSKVRSPVQRRKSLSDLMGSCDLKLTPEEQHMQLVPWNEFVPPIRDPDCQFAAPVEDTEETLKAKKKKKKKTEKRVHKRDSMSQPLTLQDNSIRNLDEFQDEARYMGGYMDSVRMEDEPVVVHEFRSSPAARRKSLSDLMGPVEDKLNHSYDCVDNDQARGLQLLKGFVSPIGRRARQQPISMGDVEQALTIKKKKKNKMEKTSPKRSSLRLPFSSQQDDDPKDDESGTEKQTETNQQMEYTSTTAASTTTTTTTTAAIAIAEHEPDHHEFRSPAPRRKSLSDLMGSVTSDKRNNVYDHEDNDRVRRLQLLKGFVSPIGRRVLHTQQLISMGDAGADPPSTTKKKKKKKVHKASPKRSSLRLPFSSQEEDEKKDYESSTEKTNKQMEYTTGIEHEPGNGFRSPAPRRKSLSDLMMGSVESNNGNSNTNTAPVQGEERDRRRLDSLKGLVSPVGGRARPLQPISMGDIDQALSVKKKKKKKKGLVVEKASTQSKRSDALRLPFSSSQEDNYNGNDSMYSPNDANSSTTKPRSYETTGRRNGTTTTAATTMEQEQNKNTSTGGAKRRKSLSDLMGSSNTTTDDEINNEEEQSRGLHLFKGLVSPIGRRRCARQPISAGDIDQALKVKKKKKKKGEKASTSTSNNNNKHETLSSSLSRSMEQRYSTNNNNNNRDTTGGTTTVTTTSGTKKKTKKKKGHKGKTDSQHSSDGASLTASVDSDYASQGSSSYHNNNNSYSPQEPTPPPPPPPQPPRPQQIVKVVANDVEIVLNLDCELAMYLQQNQDWATDGGFGTYLLQQILKSPQFVDKS